MKTNQLAKVNTLAIIGDTHCGSDVGLMPSRVKLDKGNTILPNSDQKWLLKVWNGYWDFVDELRNGEPFAIIHMGDAIDNRHHRTLDLVAGNISIQQRMIEDLMRPKVAKASAYFQIRGTAAHVGEQSEIEEVVAQNLGAIKDPKTGQFTRQALSIQLGKDRIHFAHHIGSSSSHAYKSSASMRLMAAMFAWAGEGGYRPYTIMVRAHAHDSIQVVRPNCRVVVCPCFQLKSGWAWARNTVEQPTIGGLVIRRGQWGTHIREFIRRVPEEGVVTL